MRIVHVTDCYLPRLGGIELQVHDLASKQAALGHDVTVVTTTAGPRSGADDGGLTVIRARAGRGAAERIRYRRTLNGLSQVMNRFEEFDVVHVHASSFSPLSFLAAHHASGRGVPTVATVHSLWARATPLFRAADVLAGWGDWPVIWSAVSNAAAQPLRRIVSDPSDVTVLPNGVDPDDWVVEHQPGPDGVLRIAVVSRLARRKRLHQLMEILAAAHDQLPLDSRLEVEVLGEGPRRGEIQRFLRRHDMERWVHLRGRRTRADIRQVFARSDVLIAPARLESFGIAALEARCAGVPVLALAGTGVSDFVADGREGWLVDSDAEMVTTVAHLARNPGLVAQVRDHNQTAAPTVSWPGVLATCNGLYRRAFVRHGRPVPVDPHVVELSDDARLAGRARRVASER